MEGLIMKKIIAIISIIILLLLLEVSTGYIIDNNSHLNENDSKHLGIDMENKTELAAYSEGPIDLYNLIAEIENNEYFEGYKEDTLFWMKSLPQREVFMSNDSFIIMNKKDASQLNTEYATDVSIIEYFDCVVVENRSLGGKYKNNVLLVKDVEYKGNYTHSYEV